MINLTKKLKDNEKKSFSIDKLVITYPGNKKFGDYKMTTDGIAPKHTDIVDEIYQITNSKNINQIISSLDDIYKNGTNAKNSILPISFVEKIFWITLQEEINYPQPKYKGRKLPFQRYYEAAIAKVKNIDINEIISRTNNHGKSIPELWSILDYTIPFFIKKLS